MSQHQSTALRRRDCHQRLPNLHCDLSATAYSPTHSSSAHTLPLPLPPSRHCQFECLCEGRVFRGISTQRSPHRTGADSAVCCKHLYLRGNGLWQRGALSPCSHLLRHLNRPNHSSQSVCQCWMRHHRWIVTGHSRSLPDCNRYNGCRRFD